MPQFFSRRLSYLRANLQITQNLSFIMYISPWIWRHQGNNFFIEKLYESLCNDLGKHFVYSHNFMHIFAFTSKYFYKLQEFCHFSLVLSMDMAPLGHPFFPWITYLRTSGMSWESITNNPIILSHIFLHLYTNFYKLIDYCVYYTMNLAS